MKRILDVGCDTNLYLLSLAREHPEHLYVGVDLDPDRHRADDLYSWALEDYFAAPRHRSSQADDPSDDVDPSLRLSDMEKGEWYRHVHGSMKPGQGKILYFASLQEDAIRYARSEYGDIFVNEAFQRAVPPSFSSYIATLEMRTKLIEANAFQLPFPDRSFDIVRGSGVAMLIDPQDHSTKALDECQRVLKKGKIYTTRGKIDTIV